MRLFLPLLILVMVATTTSFSVAYGAEITYRSPVNYWYSYDCSVGSPTVFNKELSGDISQYRYFGYTTGTKCFATLLDFDVSGLNAISNSTAMNFTIDSRGSIIDNRTLSSSYNTNCKILHFQHPDLLAGALITTPDVYKSSFACTNGLATVNTVYTFDSSQIGNFENEEINGHYNFALMVFPQYNASMLSNLSTNSLTFGLERLQSSFYTNGEGFTCAIIPGSGLCDFEQKPWKAIAVAFGADYIGDWFTVIVFLPFPFVAYLVTRNGTYAGFVGLGIMGAIEAINPLVFQIALTMILISASFGFYEVLKKRLGGG